MTARSIAIGEIDADDGAILFQVLNDDGTPCTDLTVGDLWIARKGDATYSAAAGSLEAVTLDSNNVGTYRYTFDATEKAVLGQGLLMVDKAGVLYTPTEFYITAHKGVIGEPTLGPIGNVVTAGGVPASETEVTLGSGADADVNEYEGAEFRVLAGKNRGYVRSIKSAEEVEGDIVITLDTELPEPCDSTSVYAIVRRSIRGLSAEELAGMFREWRDGHPPAAGIPFQMRTTTGELAPGKTVTIQVRHNNGAYVDAVNKIAGELSDGEYKWTPDPSEWKTGIVTFRATADGCLPNSGWFVVLPSGLDDEEA